MFRKRYGIKLFADYYTFSLIRDDSAISRQIEAELLPHVKRQILDDCLLCIISEFKYSFRMPNHEYHAKYRRQKENLYKRFLGKYDMDFIRYNFMHTYDYIWKDKSEVFDWIIENDIQCQFVSLANTLFNMKHWPGAYGGPAWAKICRGWLRLYNNRKNPMVDIDRCIDACHNTGNCFNKLYPEIDTWLWNKTQIDNPYWVINQSQFQRWAYRQMKELYNITFESMLERGYVPWNELRNSEHI